MKRAILLFAAGGALLLITASAIIKVDPAFVWNRSKSAPTGLYWIFDEPLDRRDWVAVSAAAEASFWASSRGFTGPDWPLIKQVRGLAGDEICRTDFEISINGIWAAEAQSTDHYGRDLPVWMGCMTLQSDEVFLLNDHPRSLDGRYFGATKTNDISGVAQLVWAWP